MIYFLVGPNHILTKDTTFTDGHPDVVAATEFYRQRIIDSMDGEDTLPGRFLHDPESDRVWRIEVKLEVSEVGDLHCEAMGKPMSPYDAVIAMGEGKPLSQVFAEEDEALNREANLEMGIDPMLADEDWGNK